MWWPSWRRRAGDDRTRRPLGARAWAGSMAPGRMRQDQATSMAAQMSGVVTSRFGAEMPRRSRAGSLSARSSPPKPLGLPHHRRHHRPYRRPYRRCSLALMRAEGTPSTIATLVGAGTRVQASGPRRRARGMVSQVGRRACRTGCSCRACCHSQRRSEVVVEMRTMGIHREHVIEVVAVSRSGWAATRVCLRPLLQGSAQRLLWRSLRQARRR